MAMTEPPANQTHYLHDPAALAGPSDSPSPAIDDLRKASCARPDASTASPQPSIASNNGPTPPSSPSAEQRAPVGPSAHSLSDIAPDQADRSSSSARAPSPLQQQQPTPPSTLPEGAAFPQAEEGGTGQTASISEHVPPLPPLLPPLPPADPVGEPFAVEQERQGPSGSHDRPTSPVSPVSPASARSSSSLSTPDDGIPNLDANEAVYLLAASLMDPTDLETRSSVTAPDPLSSPPARSDSRSSSSRPANANANAPRAPSTSSQHSSRSNLPNPPNLQGTLQIPQSSHLLPSQARLAAPVGPSERERQGPLSPELPPWQPDSEVNSCPICTTAFSFFYRKHHCRKCGRVVCAPCSPHRIVIPRSFVVYPPGTLEAELITQTYFSDDTGVEVRICNNCLAGENPSSSTGAALVGGAGGQQLVQSPSGGAGRFWQNAGPAGGNANVYVSAQNVNFVATANTPRRRAVSNINPHTQLHGGHHPGAGYPGIAYHQHQHYGQSQSLGRTHAHGFFPGQPHPPYHSHPVQQQPSLPPLQHPSPSYPHQHSSHQALFPPAHFYPSPQPAQYHHQHQGHQRSVSSSHAYSQYSPVNRPIRNFTDTSQQPVPAFSMPDTTRHHLPITSQFISSSSREQQTHSAPPQPQPRLKETDYCPICMSVLPPPNPATNDESAREAHIQECIDNAVSGHDSPRHRSASGPTTPSPMTSSQMHPTLAVEGLSVTVTATAAVSAAMVAQPSSSSGSRRERARRHTTSSRPGGSGRMVVYTAKEKDTYALGNDAEAEGQKAECVICFEEFETGDSIARLECFCRYHKKCIQEWFNRRGDGQCPVHAMNE